MPRRKMAQKIVYKGFGLDPESDNVQVVYCGEIRSINLTSLITSPNQTDIEIKNFVVSEIIKRNTIGAFEKFMNNGYRVELLNDRGQTALHLAYHRNAHDIAKLILNSLCNEPKTVNHIDAEGLSHLHIASLMGTIQVVSKYFTDNVDVNTPCCPNVQNYSRPGFSPLHLAVLNQSEDRLNILRLLIGGGANTNVKDSRGRTPLHLACRMFNDVSGDPERSYHFDDNLNVVKLLLQNQTDINAKDQDGYTPIFYVFHGNTMHRSELFNPNGILVRKALEKFQILIEHGASLTVSNNDGNTILHCIIKMLDEFRLKKAPSFVTFHDQGVAKLVEHFLTVCPEVINAKNKRIQTPLQLAVMYISIDVTKILLNYNADIRTLKFYNVNNQNFFYYPKFIPDLYAVTSLMSLIKLLQSKGFALTFTDRTVIIKFLIHKFDSCVCTPVINTRHIDFHVTDFICFGTPAHIEHLTKKYLHNKHIYKNMKYYLMIMGVGDFYVDPQVKALFVEKLTDRTVYDPYPFNMTDLPTECESLKAIYLSNNLSLYNIMKTHPHHLPSIVGQANINITIIEHLKFYHDVIKGQISKYLVRLFIKKSTFIHLGTLFPSRLPHYCLKMIFDLLSNKDLYNVCLAILNRRR